MLVILLRSSAIANPAIVMTRAVIFMYRGMVITWTVVGGILYEMKKPARMLPSASRLIGLITIGLFSLIIIEEGKRGLDIRTK